MTEHEQVLLEAYCAGCDESFDLWATTADDGATYQAPRDRLACPTCLEPADEIQPKETLS